MITAPRGALLLPLCFRWAVTLAMGERIPISSSAQLLGLKAVVKKQPEGAQFGVSASYTKLAGLCLQSVCVC